MDKKFLVFVVFAIVTQNSVLLSSTTFVGCSEETNAALDLLSEEELAAWSKSHEGFNLFFDSLKNKSCPTSSYQLTENVDISVFSDALSTVAETNDINFDGASIIVGDCDLFETALNESRAKLNASFQQFIDEIALAQGETVSNSTNSGLVSTGPTLFDMLRYCLSNISDFEEVIDEVEAQLAENFVISTTALETAIESYGTLVSGETLDENSTCAACESIEESRVALLSAVMDNVQNIFSLYKTYLIITDPNETNLVSKIFWLLKSGKLISDHEY